jgi:extradiol dioxygenase family protein
MIQSAIFHVAIPINNVIQAKKFYADGLGCTVGRENKMAVIFNFYGTQLVGHITQEKLAKQSGIYPRHLGLILSTHLDWQNLCDRALKQQLTFYQQPKLRFPNQPLEHYTFFLEDPFYNLLEFKYYRESSAIFSGTELNLIGDVAVENN